MRLRNLCSVAIFLFLSSFAYAKTSVCNIDKGEFCFDVGYLNDVSKGLYSSEDFDEEIPYKIATFGINYGLSDIVKISLLPKVNTGSLRDFSCGFQMMHSYKIPYIPLHYFTIASGSIYSEEFTKHQDAIYNRNSGVIVGAGLYYQNNSQRASLIVYSSCFYEGYKLYKKENLDIMYTDDPQTKSVNDFGVDIGTELKFGKDLRYVLKAEYTVFSNEKERSFDISLTVPFQFQFGSKS